MKKKICAWFLLLAMVLGLTACGGKDEPEMPDFVYVPEYITLPEVENGNLEVIQMEENILYYSVYRWDVEIGESNQEFFKLDLSVENATPEKLSVNMGENQDYMRMCFDAEENLYMAVRSYEAIEETDGMGGTYTTFDYDNAKCALVKYAADGSEVFRQDITDLLNSEEMGYMPYVQYLKVDKSGNVYMSTGETNVWVFDATGKALASIPSTSWISGMGKSKDGDIYISTYGNEGMVLRKVDLQTKGFGPELKGIPNNFYGDVVPGMEQDFLLKGDTALYEYDIETQTSAEVLKFIDCDMTGSYVESMSATEDGKILTYYRDWNQDVEEIVKLTKTDSSQVTVKKTLTLGGFYVSSDLQSSIVKFNKSNDEYRITIRDYSESAGNDMNAYEDALTLMNNDILTGNAPDLICLEQVNMKNLAANGAIEDLMPYLENSDVLKKEDMVESVLTAYTSNDVLCAIPTSFYIGTLMSASSIVGDEMGWTIDEMIAIADQLPENAKIMEYATKDTILQIMLLYGSDTFVDWSTGKCNFEGEEFIKVLEFANRFDAEYNYDEDAPSMPEMVEAGELLLVDQSLSQVSDFQIIEKIWGEPVTCIGFPSASGNGSVMMGEGAIAISSKSKNKDVAWEFLEKYIVDATSGESGHMWAFPSTKAGLQAVFEEAMTPEYQTDWETGEPLLDENGEKMEYSKMSWSYGDGIEYEIFAAKQEEVDKVKALIDTTTTVYSYDTQLFKMVSEEAAYFFNGQKSAQEAAKVIQGRVQVYVDENR